VSSARAKRPAEPPDAGEHVFWTEQVSGSQQRSMRSFR
jgi:hypothetical protein